jgi:oligopeptide/dipeptide ABC transporter ATP-binding protein
MKLPFHSSTLRLFALGTPLLALGYFTTPAHAQKTKPELTAQIDDTRKTYEDIALKIWNYAEIGYKETQSTALLQSTLKAAGFTVQAGVAEMPTAFVATWGEGAPVLAGFSEYDAVPGNSQQVVPHQAPRAGLHPYTAGLMACIPDLGEPRERLAQIDGAMPRLGAMPSGCAFHPRCPQAQERCHTARPALEQSGPTQAACWYPHPRP